MSSVADVGRIQLCGETRPGAVQAGSRRYLAAPQHESSLAGGEAIPRDEAKKLLVVVEFAKGSAQHMASDQIASTGARDAPSKRSRSMTVSLRAAARL
jgi:hypothetical protein